MFKRDPFVRFISRHDMSTPIRTYYEALVRFVDSKINLLLRKYHTGLVPYLCIHVYNKSLDICMIKIKIIFFCYGINGSVMAITACCYHR